MSRYYGEWAPYVSVEERRRQAERAVAKLRKTGYRVAPVTITGRLIATTVWGRAWCDNLESYGDFESRLPRGRSYVRGGSVVDLQIAPGRLTAMVSGSEVYNVVITIKETAKTQWRAICRDCAGGIDSLVELLQGRFSRGVMERLCRQEGGLFPRPSDIRFSCTCLDHALLCKHVAAALYGVGARLDQQPELLFRLRAVDETELVAGIDMALPLSKTAPAAGRLLETDDISALFGLDMAALEAPTAPAPIPSTTKRTAPAPSTTKVKGHVLVKSRANNTVAPQRASVARTTPTQPRDLKRAASKEGAAKVVVPKQKAAVVEATARRQKPMRVPQPANAPGQVETVSVATPRRSEPPLKDRSRRVRTDDLETPIRKPKPKPVKWW
jgi:hypothetical protein